MSQIDRRPSQRPSLPLPSLNIAQLIALFVELRDLADELVALLERVAQEYRKRAVFVCASGQIWTAARTSSELRDSFASVLCHRMIGTSSTPKAIS